MAGPLLRLLFLIDECVPRSVADCFASHGHEVRQARNYMPPKSPDTLVLTIGDQMRAVVVTWNHDDFATKGYLTRADGERKYPQLRGLITFRCAEPDGVARLQRNIRMVEAAFLDEDAQPILIVGPSNLRSVG